MCPLAPERPSLARPLGYQLSQILLSLLVWQDGSAGIWLPHTGDFFTSSSSDPWVASLSEQDHLCACIHVKNPTFHYLSHLLQREFRPPVLCFSQVWIFSAPTIQFYTFLGLDISCGSGNIMTHLNTFLR